ncbi:TetR/AcrR family transcriptional regulator [Bacillus testis]|uniref:TetR/AcrR family transcriptional regulator n=1 Tax=Bacillus testis TaxID=1622072 RepID=UPI00067F0250|nr:TetR/AcrR family transcriptional regulator [Bacillus testis]
MKKTRNAVNVFAKDCIAIALFKLMKEKKYEDITITDIANTAGVSRVTYYRNFNSKEEVIMHYLDELGYRFKQENKHLDPMKDTYACVLACFRYWHKHRDFLLGLHEAKLAYVWLEHLNTSISLFTTTPKKKYEGCFFLGAMHNILFEWIKGGANESPEEMAAIVSDLFHLPVPVPAPTE